MQFTSGHAEVTGARLYYEVAGHMSNMDRPGDFNRLALDFLSPLSLGGRG